MLHSQLIQFFRILVIIAISFFLSFFTPAFNFSASTGVIVGTLVLYAFLLGFFVNRALEREQVIYRGVSHELLYLRHIFHLCEYISNKKWVGKVFESVVDYQKAVGRSFLMHATTSGLFRAVSHLIYSFQPKTPKDQTLFSDLLETTRNLAIERQQIQQAITNRLSGYSWLVMLTNASFGILLLLFNRYQPQYSPLGCALLIASILLLLDLLQRTDNLSSTEIHALETAYRSNLPREHV